MFYWKGNRRGVDMFYWKGNRKGVDIFYWKGNRRDVNMFKWEQYRDVWTFAYQTKQRCVKIRLLLHQSNEFWQS